MYTHYSIRREDGEIVARHRSDAAASRYCTHRAGIVFLGVENHAAYVEARRKEYASWRWGVHDVRCVGNEISGGVLMSRHRTPEEAQAKADRLVPDGALGRCMYVVRDVDADE